jgi:hypothetical protein
MASTWCSPALIFPPRDRGNGPGRSAAGCERAIDRAECAARQKSQVTTVTAVRCGDWQARARSGRPPSTRRAPSTTAAGPPNRAICKIVQYARLALPPDTGASTTCRLVTLERMAADLKNELKRGGVKSALGAVSGVSPPPETPPRGLGRPAAVVLGAGISSVMCLTPLAGTPGWDGWDTPASPERGCAHRPRRRLAPNRSR